MTPPAHKTKIVCTIGPASNSTAVQEQLIRSGLNVARLNFSHGDFQSHGQAIHSLRAAAAAAQTDIAIMADLPGPKMRIGQLAEDPIELSAGESFVLTTEEIIGDHRRVGVSFTRLPSVVRPGDALYLNDGLIQLEVRQVQGNEVLCRTIVGGELRSRKGLNLPGIDLGMSAFTPHDRACLQFALECGVDGLSQSFVESAADILAVRQAARALGQDPFVLAKIERARALEHLDEILDAADGIMIARGDLGVEVPIERIAVLQKQLVQKARRLGKPVITATQMLESMTHSRQPTRAEATDVANAILDGTDCVMLSGESAMGKYPVEAVATLARIAAATEPHRPRLDIWESLKNMPRSPAGEVRDLIALSIEAVFGFATPAAVIVPTRSGATARSIARFRLPVWVAAASPDPAVCRGLHFSYGIVPLRHSEPGGDWSGFARRWVRDQKWAGQLALLVQGPSAENPAANHKLEVIELDRPGS